MVAEQKDELSLHRFLGTLLSPILPPEEKRIILENEFQVPVTGAIGRRINIMCDLSEAILEQGIERGIEQGIEQGMTRGAEKERYDMIYKMFQSGVSFEQIRAVVQDKVSDEALRESEREVVREKMAEQKDVSEVFSMNL